MRYRSFPGIRELNENLDQSSIDRSFSYKMKIFGISLTLIGILVFSLKIVPRLGICLGVIGILVFSLFPADSTQIELAKKIIFFLIGWIFFVLFIGDTSTLDTFFFLIVVGMVICKELTEVLLTSQLKKRLTILILMFFSASMILFIASFYR
jgi:hypothetical protein